MNTTQKLLLSLLASAAVQPAFAVNIISLSVASPKNSSQNLMSPADMAGAPGVRVPNWNNLLAAADGSRVDIVLTNGTVLDSTGALVNDLQVTMHSTQNGGGYVNRTAGGANDPRMFADVDDVFEATGFATYGYLDLTNIPFARYDIYCYFRPDNGSTAANTRGGFFTVTNAPGGVVRRYLKNQDITFTQLNVPANDGSGYVLSTTASIPSGGTDWTNINGGNYVILSGLTNRSCTVWFGALGGGASAMDDAGNYVNGGSGARRLKVPGFQIVEVSGSTPTSIYLGEPVPLLHAGSPAAYQLTVLADLADGSSGVLVSAQPGVTYTSKNTNVFTVTDLGRLYPNHSGTADLIAKYQNLSLTQAVTVLAPTAVYPNLSLNPLYVETAGVGEKVQATLLADYADASAIDISSYKYISYSGNAPSVANVTTSGLVTAVGVGSFTLQATCEGVSGLFDASVELFTPPVTTTGARAVSYDIEAGKTMGLRQLAGAPDVRVANWNGLVLTHGAFDTVTATGAVDSSGAKLPAITVSINALGAVAAYVRNGQGVEDSVMYGSILDMNENRAGESVLPYGGSTLSVGNIPFDAYRIYFYFQNDRTTEIRPAVFQIAETGEAHWVRTSANGYLMPLDDGTGYEEANYTLPVTNGVTLLSDIPYGNFVKSGVLSSSSVTVNFGPVSTNWFADADVAAPRLKFSGFQLVEEFVPKLTATLVGASLKLSWSDSFPTFNLMTRSALDQAWSAVGSTPVHEGSIYSVTVPTTGGQAFYRLQSP